MAAVPLLRNADARRLFLHLHGLSGTPTGPGRGDDLYQVIHQLGFVQLDSINTVCRAHHMILHARRQAYRPKHLDPLLEKDRKIFEHWTHDASVIPTEFFPHWRLKFARNGEKLLRQWKSGRRNGFDRELAPVLDQIRANGAVCSADVGEGEKRGSGGWWDWHPSKTALEYLWHTGELSVTKRVAFRKFYDLTERVIPTPHIQRDHPDHATVDWACNAALDRLGFATSGELADFWDLVTKAETKAWCETALDRGDIVEVDVENCDRSLRRHFARANVLDAAENAVAPTSAIRILSPFDPALRDRRRAERLFGFDYRIEVFVPEAKRTYGYYVFPVMEADGLIGRIDMKCDRKANTLNVTAFWPENRVSMGKGRMARLMSALDRTRRFAGVDDVTFAPDWLRS